MTRDTRGSYSYTTHRLRPLHSNHLSAIAGTCALSSARASQYRLCGVSLLFLLYLLLVHFVFARVLMFLFQPMQTQLSVFSQVLLLLSIAYCVFAQSMYAAVVPDCGDHQSRTCASSCSLFFSLLLLLAASSHIFYPALLRLGYGSLRRLYEHLRLCGDQPHICLVLQRYKCVLVGGPTPQPASLRFWLLSSFSRRFLSCVYAATV